jgi:hypothetical protein
LFFSTKSTIRSLELPIHPISVVSSHLKSYPKKNGQANPGGDAAVQHDWALVPASLQDDVWNPGKDQCSGITNAFIPFGINEFLQIGWVVGVRGRYMFVLFRI